MYGKLGDIFGRRPLYLTAQPITEGLAYAIDAVKVTADVLTGVAFLISFGLPNKKLTDRKAVPQESVPAH